MKLPNSLSPNAPTSGGVEIHKSVQTLIIFLLWSPLIMVLNGAAAGAFLALTGIGLRIYQTGQIPNLEGISMPVNPTLLTLGVMAFFGFLFLILANATLGTSNVNSAFDQGQEIQDEVEE